MVFGDSFYKYVVFLIVRVQLVFWLDIVTPRIMVFPNYLH
jgi:hypothetical protein